MGEHAKISSIAIDRGFMDGTLLWWLNSEGITFYIPAKSNMNVYEDALSLVDTGCRSIRTRNRNISYGKNKTVVTDYWDVQKYSKNMPPGEYLLQYCLKKQRAGALLR